MSQFTARSLLFRSISEGMGQAVAERTILRKKENGEFEDWGDVAERVAKGNSSLFDGPVHSSETEYQLLLKHIANGNTLMSGRHLQHGDAEQKTRNMEIFTNCGDFSTEIITAEYGVCSLGELVGQTVTIRARDGQWRPATIHEHGKQEIFRLTFNRKSSGQKHQLIANFTRNHRWFLQDGTATDQIMVGDVLEKAPNVTDFCTEGIQHGLIFGDGSAHKSRIDYPGRLHSPAYIAGFIHGWWLADGSKTLPSGTIEISTSDEQAAEWLKRHAAYIGATVVGGRIITRKEGDGSYANGKPLHIIRLSTTATYILESIESLGVQPVFCPEEPVTSGFVLANGLLTGNCATSSTSFLLFYLLLNGSGVGRCYDDDLILVNWDYAPSLRCVLDSAHPDFNYSAHESVRDAIHKYGKEGPNVMWFEVPDSREGWAKALEIWENAAWEKIHSGKMLILDFSKVRAKGQPINGMQKRPASGPVALMDAFEKAAKLKGAGLEPWRQAIYLDHYFAECVLVGGARRAARMSTKQWSDPTIFDFITIKRPLEFYGKNTIDILEYRKTNTASAFLWSSNNSVTVDDEFWNLVHNSGDKSLRAKHAKKVFKLVCTAAYADGTGEPGFINSHKLVQKDDGWNDLNRGDYVGSKKYQINDDTQILMSRLAKRAKKKKYHMIVNPCGEIALNVLGGFCTISDVVPFHCETLEDAEECFRVVTRALMRVNLMDSIYNKEVQRTNRIGVGITGIHEFAFKFYGFGFRDLIDEEKSKPFWMQMARFNSIVHEEAVSYAKELEVKPPHTETTIKPAGTTSKLFSLTEGWHLPSMEYFLRWVQFRNDDPLVQNYKNAGYPIRELTQYSGTTIVGFPTEPTITTLGMGDKLVTAANATPEEQFKWLMLGEKYWIHGVTPDGKHVEESNGNQISYTLKYKPTLVDFDHFKKMILKYQSQVRCCSVMPQEETSTYEYLPEQAIGEKEFLAITKKIRHTKLKEDIGREHVGCDNGACPVDFNSGQK